MAYISRSVGTVFLYILPDVGKARVREDGAGVMIRTQVLLAAKKGKRKKKRLLVKLQSTAGTGYFYVTSKNPQNTPHKIMLRKYDPVVNAHVMFEERKLKFSTFRPGGGIFPAAARLPAFCNPLLGLAGSLNRYDLWATRPLAKDAQRKHDKVRPSVKLKRIRIIIHGATGHAENTVAKRLKRETVAADRVNFEQAAAALLS
eukprot:g5814.t1